ncbi:translation initiation factor IF-3 [Mycoplasmopsis opalescens]|uniref:translation initiation factor IF-3 n=1 Tax=Mycoplasmopsis opalescens TaxID=114886 RepID=UPI0004A7235C|nr:translation initiation factor IF-3 [Mycoplasmopsis opalescens]
MVNYDIPFPKVFVIGSNGDKIGVLPTTQAVQMAKDEGNDLVLIATEPKPIARILNYGKFKYERKKKQKIAKEKQTTIQNRQIRLTAMIGDNDILVKARKAREFLLDGDRIKVSLKFRGREVARPELGHQVLNKFYAHVEDLADIAKEATLVNERFLDLYIQPNKIKVQKFKKLNNLTDKPRSTEQVEADDDNDDEE